MRNPYQLETYLASEYACLKDDPEVFAIIRHGNQSVLNPAQPFDIQLALPPLGEEKIEVWRSREPLISGTFKQVHFKHSDTFLVGALLLDEADFDDLASTTFNAYEQIHDALESTGFPALTRMWNFFPRINEGATTLSDDLNKLERYRTFCLGRHKALDEWHFTEELLPAASAIGAHNNGLVIYFLAARQPGIQIENPRQISAYRYPKQYGPKSPSFSRATYKNWGKSQHLYISGTASIVGHTTEHDGDPIAQLDETLRNIRTIIEQAQSLHDVRCHTISDLSAIRIFIRHPAQAEQILNHLRRAIGESDCEITAVHGDICRSDLLLEIEGHYID
ncbi:hypothetical protein ACFL2V_09270 [Pseudomonadota bacterium]